METENNSAIANKLLNQDGSITNFNGDILQAASDYGIEDWQSRAPIANKFENPDGTIHTLDEIISGDTYSTTEVDTGKKWIDGKAIYKIVFSGNITCAANVSSTEIIVSSGIDKLINYSVFLQNGSSSSFFSMDGNYSAGTLTVSGKIFCSGDNKIQMYTFSAFARDGMVNSGYYGFVEYTKI
jgi:hypothetical protein